MAANVFGEPVINETLKKMAEFQGIKEIKRLDRARVALQKMHADNKDTNARTYGETTSFGQNGTICLIYNATGDPVTLVDFHDWSGKIGRSPYPLRLENGQWGVFFHRQGGQASSQGAVVYDGKNNFDTPCQWVMCWKQAQGEDSTCHAGLHQDAYRGLNWKIFSDELQKGKVRSHLDMSMCTSTASIGNDDVAIMEGIMSLNSAW